MSAYCSLVDKVCKFGNNALLCAQQSTRTCMALRDREEKEEIGEIRNTVVADVPDSDRSIRG